MNTYRRHGIYLRCPSISFQCVNKACFNETICFVAINLCLQVWEGWLKGRTDQTRLPWHRVRGGPYRNPTDSSQLRGKEPTKVIKSLDWESAIVGAPLTSSHQEPCSQLLETFPCESVVAKKKWGKNRLYPKTFVDSISNDTLKMTGGCPLSRCQKCSQASRPLGTTWNKWEKMEWMNPPVVCRDQRPILSLIEKMMNSGIPSDKSVLRHEAGPTRECQTFLTAFKDAFLKLRTQPMALMLQLQQGITM